MGKRHSETEVLSRNMGLRYNAAYTAANYVEYEGWSIDPTAEDTEAKFQICKHTYDANGNLTATNWAKPVGGKPTDDFIFVWNDRATYF